MFEQPQKPKGVADWLKESATVKVIFIGILIIVLLIPSSLIQNLISERAGRQEEVLKEVSDSWSGSQLVKGPVLVIPYKKTERYLDSARREAYREVEENLYILPEKLNYKATVNPEERHRGLFKVVVYNSKIKVSGNFGAVNPALSGIAAAQLRLDRAYLTFEIADLKGLKNNPVIKAAGQNISTEPVVSGNALFKNGLLGTLNLTALNGNGFSFDYDLDIKGSGELHFMHLGKITDAQVSGNWGSPSFDGRYLPDTSNIATKAFSAQWRMSYFNRPFPQQWLDDNNLLDAEKKQQDSTFGLTLRLPVDDYQKTMRTNKYAILIILLTFVSLFLTELISKQRVHAFNYILIGAAMIIYYTLLLSFSEQIGFNYAYLVASVATVALVTAFIASLLKNKKAAGLLSVILSIFYVFIFVIIQLEDLALMAGSIALFIIIAVLMYVSRKINWDNQ